MPATGVLRSSANIGRGAGDGAGGGQSAKHGRGDIGDALRDQFDIGIVAVVDVAGIAHAIGNHGRHQRFDRAQHGDGQSRTEQSVNQVGAKRGNVEMRQAARIPSKREPMVSTGSLKIHTASGARHQSNNRAGDAIGKGAAYQNDDNGANRQRRSFERNAYGN